MWWLPISFSLVTAGSIRAQALCPSAGGQEVITKELEQDYRGYQKERRFKLAPTQNEFDILALMVERLSGPNSIHCRSPRCALEVEGSVRHQYLLSPEYGWDMLAGTW